MQKLAEACEWIVATTKKLEKIAIVAGYLKSRTPEEAAVSAVFLSGRAFPLWEETTLQVGGSLLWRIVGELAGKSEAELTAAYRRHGDLGAVAGEVLPATGRGLTVIEVQERFRQIAAARGPAAKGVMVRELLSLSAPIDKAYGVTLKDVQRANMLLGDIGETLKFALAGKLIEAKMRLFHPLGFMLASPAESAEEALSYFEKAAVEDKYDGIRAQAHCAGGEVRIFSRTRDDITESFPELPGALAGLPEDVILDGEIVAWSYLAAESNEPGRALPFSALQQRLGRKKVSDEMMRQVPVAYLAFDVLYARGELLLDRPWRERAQILDQLLSAIRTPVARHSRGSQARLTFEDGEQVTNAKVIRAPVFRASSAQELSALFEAAQARGNEGLMIKDIGSIYAPGRRGKSWLKLKRELATLDVVVTSVEYGHGKRIGVLSDYTFAVRDGERLLNIGKAYSGLTDAEIAEMTKWFLEHRVEDQGFRLIVEPKIVLEVAFNNMMRSERHNSGFALRFPRIVRIRHDKLPEEADTIERVREIYAAQKN
ncbi:MAG: ATP-dependent DNA ligase [Acidobacteria bacterium]|nr:MAG: ATP-dependent DNA ligase [Acidobacteriota bacterium]